MKLNFHLLFKHTMYAEKTVQHFYALC